MVSEAAPGADAGGPRVISVSAARIHCALGLLLLALSWFPGPLAAEPLTAAQGLAVPPDDRAVVVFYRLAPVRGAATWDQWHTTLQVRGLTEGRVTVDHAGTLPAGNPRLATGEALRVELLPGEVEFLVFRVRRPGRRQVLQTHSETLSLTPGSVTLIRVDAFNDAPVIQAQVPETLVDPQSLRWARHDLAGWQLRALHGMHAGALAIEPPLDPRCLPGERRVRWANAELLAELRDCAWQPGKLRWQDGSELSTRFRVEGGVMASVGVSHYVSGYTRVVLCAIPGSPLTEGAGELFFSPCGFVGAIDGVAVDAGGGVEPVIARLRGAPGTSVDLTVVDVSGRRLAERRIERVRLPNALGLVPEGMARVEYADGRRYFGPVRLPSADETGTLPPAEPLAGIGQLTWPDGSGYLGEFLDGQAHGAGWCFDRFDLWSGEPCRYQDGEALLDTGALQRSPEAILAMQPGLPPSVAVDFLRQRHIEALLAENWPTFLQLDADLAALGADSGVEALFFAARALHALGRPEPAMTRLTAYLTLAGSEGGQYGAALGLFAELQPQLDAARSQRSAEELTSRQAREAFCAAALAEELRPCGCAEHDLGGSTAECL